VLARALDSVSRERLRDLAADRWERRCLRLDRSRVFCAVSSTTRQRRPPLPSPQQPRSRIEVVETRRALRQRSQIDAKGPARAHIVRGARATARVRFEQTTHSARRRPGSTAMKGDWTLIQSSGARESRFGSAVGAFVARSSVGYRTHPAHCCASGVQIRRRYTVPSAGSVNSVPASLPLRVPPLSMRRNSDSP